MAIKTKDGWYLTDEEIKEAVERQKAEGIKHPQVVISVTRSTEPATKCKLEILKNQYKPNENDRV